MSQSNGSSKKVALDTWSLENLDDIIVIGSWEEILGTRIFDYRSGDSFWGNANSDWWVCSSGSSVTVEQAMTNSAFGGMVEGGIAGAVGGAIIAGPAGALEGAVAGVVGGFFGGAAYGVGECYGWW
jgi:hypothetical protein